MGTKISTNGQRQTATLNYEMSTLWETKPRTTPRNTLGRLMGPEQGTRPKILQAYVMMMVMVVVIMVMMMVMMMMVMMMMMMMMISVLFIYFVKVKVKQSRYRPGKALRFPGG